MDAPEKIALRWELGAAVTNGPLMTHPDYTRFVSADLCADPALLAEAVEVLRYVIDNACGAAEIKGNKLVIVCTNEEWEAHVAATNAARAFIAKLENRHDR